MARIYQPLEIQKDGKGTGLFHMTVGSDEENWIMPVGKCAEKCPGHATPDEAVRHWKEGKLEGIRFDGFDEDTQKKCAICSAWTQKAALIDGEFFEMFPLCDAHLNIHSVVKLYLNEPAAKT